MARQLIISLALIFIAAFATVVSGDLLPSTSPSSSPASAPSKSTASLKASPVPSAAPVPSTAKTAAPVPSSTITATPGVSPVGSAVKEPSSPPLPFDDTVSPVGAAVPSVAPAVDVAAPGPSEVLADALPSGAASLKVSAAVGATVAVGVLFF